jgi:lipopolysaccharide biosynthesis glycosyltransferase
MKTAIAVVATGDYMEGAKVLFHSLERNGLPDSVDRLVIGFESCGFASPVVMTEDYAWVGITDPRCHETLKNFFPLTLNYDRVISMNADMLCLRDPSYLWSDRIGALPFYATHDTAAQTYYPDNLARLGLDPLLILNAGLYVYHRDRMPDLHERMIQEIADHEIETYEVGDQGFWNHFFQRHHLEIGYLSNGLNYCLDRHMPQLPELHQRIVHFTGGKPWKCCPSPSYWTYPYYKQWQDERARCSHEYDSRRA